ncbi:MAG: PhoH family protein, partial [Rhodobiaceae bacterium]
YLRPLYDALYDMMPADKVERMLVSGEIEIAPLAFMRGRTLSASYVIIDEAQNTTPVQMKMVLTRLGQDSRMVITGDLSQIDLPEGQPSGLADAVARLDNVEGVGIKHLSGKDVVRHPVVARILQAYESDS